MNRTSEKIYMYEKTAPSGGKKIIEMSESQIVKHMKRDLKYPKYKSRQDLISEFIAIYFAVDKNKWNRNESCR